jgi:molecular chaperone GrpE
MKDQQETPSNPDSVNGEGEGAPAAAEESSGTGADAETEALRARVREAESRLRVVSKAYTDLEADMDAFRRRMTANADQRVERKSAEVVEHFFEPVMNLKRSLAAGASDPSATLVGLNMTLQQFQEALAKLGLEEVPGTGAPFDPKIHEALAITPVTDAAQDGRVLMVHATGYRVGSKVLQPAQVIIGKMGTPPEA